MLQYNCQFVGFLSSDMQCWYCFSTLGTPYIQHYEALCVSSSVQSHWSQTKEIKCCIWTVVIWILSPLKVMF